MTGERWWVPVSKLTLPGIRIRTLSDDIGRFGHRPGVYLSGWVVQWMRESGRCVLCDRQRLRYETTGIRLEHLREAMPLKQAQRKIQDLLRNGEPIWKIRSKDTKARILIGHGLDHDLDCLRVEYPAFLIRDTAKYPPLMKTSKLSNSLKYLTRAYLG
ncbi:RNA exonuclease 4 [Ananas comosus]|uniref:RNA exonuclease 4 n=1 Tax=Ananas comosus TaxID=4615 RepID=A0A199V1Y3_ANACO|nr:RNA exonuclease 4 [Ananas comosus]